MARAYLSSHRCNCGGTTKGSLSAANKRRIFLAFVLAARAVIALSPCICAVAIHLALAGVLLASEGSPEKDILEEFEAVKGGDCIIIPVRVAEATLEFIVDTGFTSSAFSLRHRAKLGRPTGRVEVKAPGGLVDAERFSAPKMTLGETELAAPKEVICTDLDSFEYACGRRIDGILGMDVLKQMVLQIDFDAGRVRFLKSADDRAGRALPIVWRPRRVLNVPFVATTIDGDLPCDFMIDTGCIWHTVGTLEFEAFDILADCRAMEPLRQVYYGHGMSGAVRIALGRLHSMEIAGFQHKNAIFGRVPYPPSLGIGFLSRYVSTFDFPNSVVYLRPGKLFGEVDCLDQTGIALGRVDGVIIVDAVQPQSPGNRAGLTAGDAIVRVDDMSVSHWSFYRVRRVLAAPGRHAIVVRRRDEQASMKLIVAAAKGSE